MPYTYPGSGHFDIVEDDMIVRQLVPPIILSVTGLEEAWKLYRGIPSLILVDPRDARFARSLTSEWGVKVVKVRGMPLGAWAIVGKAGTVWSFPQWRT